MVALDQIRKNNQVLNKTATMVEKENEIEMRQKNGTVAVKGARTSLAGVQEATVTRTYSSKVSLQTSKAIVSTANQHRSVLTQAPSMH